MSSEQMKTEVEQATQTLFNNVMKLPMKAWTLFNHGRDRYTLSAGNDEVVVTITEHNPDNGWWGLQVKLGTDKAVTLTSIHNKNDSFDAYLINLLEYAKQSKYYQDLEVANHLVTKLIGEQA